MFTGHSKIFNELAGGGGAHSFCHELHPTQCGEDTRALGRNKNGPAAEAAVQASNRPRARNPLWPGGGYLSPESESVVVVVMNT